MKTQSATQTLARLGASHGYRFDGDVVFLNASFIADASADAGRSWALRLVAGDIRDGHVIAQAALPPLAELTGAVENFEVAAPAVAPAARGFHTLSLVLVSRDAAGVETIADSVAYEIAQAFAQPRLAGPVGFWFEGDELVLDIDHIENNRAADNLSGTLSLEVWASDRAYAGGPVLGQPVAGAILGSLAGGQSWTPGALHLCATKPAAGAHLVVALREWNGSAYVTRDFVSFAPAPAPVAEAVSAAPEVVAEAPATSASVVAKAVETVKNALAAVAEPVKAKVKSAAKPKSSAKPKAEKPAAKSKKKSSK